MQKLYCYVDETGQDPGSEVFIVVAVIVTSNLNAVRERLEDLEKTTRINNVKWHKASYNYRIKFMEEFLRADNKDLHIYFIKVKKPVFYYPSLGVKPPPSGGPFKTLIYWEYEIIQNRFPHLV